MFRVIYNDLVKFLKHHFLASIIIAIAYYTFTKILVDGAFQNQIPLIGYKFFHGENFIANLFIYSVIVSVTFLISAYYYDHRKVDTDFFLKDMRDILPRFILGGMFATIIIIALLYLTSLLGNIAESTNIILYWLMNFLIIFIMVLMLKILIVYFPMLYYQPKESIPSIFREAVRRSSWVLLVYYLIIAGIFCLASYTIYYIFDIISLFQLMNIGIEEMIQAYFHVLIILVQISMYRQVVHH